MDDQAKLAECIFDQAADTMIFADRSGTIRRWNRASAALFGLTAEEALGQNLDLIVPGHLRAAHWRGFDDAMANGVLKLQGRPAVCLSCSNLVVEEQHAPYWRSDAR